MTGVILAQQEPIVILNPIVVILMVTGTPTVIIPIGIVVPIDIVIQWPCLRWIVRPFASTLSG
jgi:hypothetical protein